MLNNHHDASFTSALDNFFAERNCTRPIQGYFRLPDHIRLKICKYLIGPLPEKPIQLNNMSFDQDVWRKTDFSCASKVLSPLKAYLSVSFAFRADVLIALLQHATFHVTISPYVGPRVSPLATTWANLYGPYMDNIAIELDFTKLGFGPLPDASGLLTGMGKFDKLLNDFVQAQLRRSEARPISSLILLCRRFYGQRESEADLSFLTSPAEHSRCESAHSQYTERSDSPIPRFSHDSDDTATYSPDQSLSLTPTLTLETTDDSADSDRSTIVETPDPSDDSDCPVTPVSPIIPIDYCPDSYLNLCNHLLGLSNRISSLRMCGFSEAYTNRFIATLFPAAGDHLERHSYRVAPSILWPRLFGQKSCVDTGDGLIVLDNHDMAKSSGLLRALSRWEGCRQLPPPHIDAQGETSLPPAIDALQRVRARTLSSTASLPEQILPQNIELDLIPDPGQMELEKTKIRRLLGMYGKKETPKRPLSHEATTTL